MQDPLAEFHFLLDFLRLEKQKDFEQRLPR